ncbi:hypothetical protein B0J14DRAFT_687973 [Halenospora varia]|nr:hypothetical protein B0J14DRAFT_687973 [Halenospora varia]
MSYTIQISDNDLVPMAKDCKLYCHVPSGDLVFAFDGDETKFFKTSKAMDDEYLKRQQAQLDGMRKTVEEIERFVEKVQEGNEELKEDNKRQAREIEVLIGVLNIHPKNCITSKTEDYLQLKLSRLLKDNETLEHISKMYESYNSRLIDEVQELRKENKELKEQIEKLQPKTEEECSYSRLEKENERLQNLLDILVDAIEVMVPLLGKTMAKADIGGESSSSLSTIKEEGEVDTLERVKAVAEGYNKLFNFTRFGLR